MAILIAILAPQPYTERLANVLGWGIYVAALAGCLWIVYWERQWLRSPPSPMMLVVALLLIYLPTNPRWLALVIVCAALGAYWIVARSKHLDAEASLTGPPSARPMPYWQKFVLAVALVFLFMIMLRYALWLTGRYL